MSWKLEGEIMDGWKVPSDQRLQFANWRAWPERARKGQKGPSRKFVDFPIHSDFPAIVMWLFTRGYVHLLRELHVEGSADRSRNNIPRFEDCAYD